MTLAQIDLLASADPDFRAAAGPQPSNGDRPERGTDMDLAMFASMRLG